MTADGHTEGGVESKGGYNGSVRRLSLRCTRWLNNTCTAEFVLYTLVEQCGVQSSFDVHVGVVLLSWESVLLVKIWLTCDDGGNANSNSHEHDQLCNLINANDMQHRAFLTDFMMVSFAV